MKHQRSNKAYVHGALLALNVSMAGMFAVILAPTPAPAVATEGWRSKSFSLHAPSSLQRTKKEVYIGIPRRVVVPSVQLDIKVETGTYAEHTKSWSLADDRAFYANISVPANNNNGTTLVYGHATNQVFGRIGSITNGAEAKIYTNEGLIFTYIYQSSRQVMPADTTVFSTYSPPMLVLQTCSGVFDTHRTLVAFTFAGVAKDD